MENIYISEKNWANENAWGKWSAQQNNSLKAGVKWEREKQYARKCVTSIIGLFCCCCF